MKELLVVTDLDGTLWGKGQFCHPKTIQSFKRLQKNNIEVIAATARTKKSTEFGLALNGLKCAAIMLNGCIGKDYRNNFTFLANSFSKSNVSTIISILSHLDYPFKAYSVNGNHDFQSDSNKYTIIDIASLALHNLTLKDSKSISQHIPQKLASQINTFDIYTDTYSLIIQPKNTSKASSVETYIRTSKNTKPYIVAVGNGENDISLFKIADLAIACKSSVPEVFEHCDIVIGDPEDGGWAEVEQIINNLLPF